MILHTKIPVFSERLPHGFSTVKVHVGGKSPVFLCEDHELTLESASTSFFVDGSSPTPNPPASFDCAAALKQTLHYCTRHTGPVTHTHQLRRMATTGLSSIHKDHNDSWHGTVAKGTNFPPQHGRYHLYIGKHSC